ncbi:MAG TPA: LysE family translocator [Thermoanaerobaculia bacterium]|jgi:threonine/homoserine/homoserine lactone efflux protein|nr:LysE family translocator [Thermoanaerobaculia bacterium]
MPTFTNLLLFLGAALALNLTPGPDMLYVAARGSSEGRGAGVVSALGIAAGCLVHIAALALGFSALLERVPAAYDAVRLGGAAYLIWLGVRALWRPSALGAVGKTERAPLGRIFRQGIVTNVLNPKVALFFLAFLPQFVDPGRGPVAGQLVFLGLLFNTSGTLVNLGVALAASRATTWLRARQRASQAMQRVTGAVFVGLGLRLAMAGRR